MRSASAPTPAPAVPPGPDRSAGEKASPLPTSVASAASATAGAPAVAAAPTAALNMQMLQTGSDWPDEGLAVLGEAGLLLLGADDGCGLDLLLPRRQWRKVRVADNSVCVMLFAKLELSHRGPAATRRVAS